MKNKKIKPCSVVNLIAVFDIVSTSIVTNAFIIGNLDFQILYEEERTEDVAWSSEGPSDTQIDSLFIPASVEINGNKYNVTEIRQHGVSSCKNIGIFISIPGSVKKIGVGAFLNLENVDYIELNKGLEIIEAVAFESSHIKTVNIPSYVKEIGSYAWVDCVALTDVNWPEHLTTIPGHCFDGCNSLKPWNFSNITYIGTGGFSGCSSFENVVIPGGCEVGTGGLWGYGGKHLILEPGNTVLWYFALIDAELTRLESPEGITLYTSVLGYCNNLRSLTIHPGTHLGHRSFWEYQWKNWNSDRETIWERNNLLALDSVIYLADVPVVMDAEVFTPNVYQNAVLYVKSEAVDKAKTTLPWSRFKQINAIPAGVKEFISDENSDIPNAPIETIYSLEGYPCGNNTDNLPRGIYIIRYKNGKTKNAYQKLRKNYNSSYLAQLTLKY